MKLTFQIPSVFEEQVEASQSETIAELKQRICRKVGIESSLTTLLLKGRQLSEEKKVADMPSPSPPIIVDYLWSRSLISWGIIGLQILRSATIFLAGAGALGNEIAKNLSMIGIGKILIADHDIIERSNLSRTVFFEEKDLGKPKAQVLVDTIKKIYPYIKVKAFNERIENIPKKIFLDSDLIISGLDNLVSRIHLTSIARRYHIPLVDGGMIGTQGRVQTYIPPDYPCPICLLPQTNFKDILGLRNPCGDPVDDIIIPAFPTSTSVISGIQTHEAVKTLFNSNEKVNNKFGEPLEGILIIDLQYNKYSIISLKKNPQCIVCGKDGIAKDTVERIEIPLKLFEGTTNLKKIISEKLGKNLDDLQLFIEYPDLQQISDKETKKIDLKKTRYIHAIFKKTREYKEALITLIS